MFNLPDELKALLLVFAANAGPVVVAKLTRERATAPLDFGYVLRDGERLFGAHKTWRGLLFGTAACALVGGFIGVPAWLGVSFGAVSLLGDAVSSAMKRRLGLKPGTEALGLDQLGEALLPLLLFARPLGLQVTGMLFVIAAFFVLDALATPLRHRAWIKTARHADYVRDP